MQWEYRELVIPLPRMKYDPALDWEDVRQRLSDWIAWQLDILHKHEGWIADEPTGFGFLMENGRISINVTETRDWPIYTPQEVRVRAKRLVG